MINLELPLMIYLEPTHSQRSLTYSSIVSMGVPGQRLETTLPVASRVSSLPGGDAPSCGTATGCSYRGGNGLFDGEVMISSYFPPE